MNETTSLIIILDVAIDVEQLYFYSILYQTYKELYCSADRHLKQHYKNQYTDPQAHINHPNFSHTMYMGNTLIWLLSGFRLFQDLVTLMDMKDDWNGNINVVSFQLNLNRAVRDQYPQFSSTANVDVSISIVCQMLSWRTEN